ncbi:glycoside hydrolase family 2 TIM barrel-domain containing protein [Flavivirga amylovorans]|uniref:Glycoside hydrolase family 2 TIM barrel-domain containing protein n=1 Tax=Flavivirga amylovorans TaxID=870486 RepID=A0ABT8WVW6_9FLAO|nr:sugar-binding domain-containing protein [Flavivirga amylovorans]MDO5985830.1 glycoside hydrolase family 2 TIM barrel-domain containing protein [Flavivirga amylovorans]
MKIKLVSLFYLFVFSVLFAQEKKVLPEFSKAGFWEVENAGRKTYNFNLGWRFIKSDVKEAHQKDFDDSKWKVINCPHGLEYITSESTGGNNYQGVAWYRKHFKIDEKTSQKRLKLHFEAIMGKSKIWLNGHLIGEHFGGYLPVVVDLDQYLNKNGDNVIAVWADNSDDATYPPGKPQKGLDMTYFGGIYRDVWLVATNKIYVTNPMEVDKVAGGGIFTSIESLSDKEVVVNVKVDIQNDDIKTKKLKATILLKNPNGKVVVSSDQKLSIKKAKALQIHESLVVDKPSLWSPWSPKLYKLEVLLSDDSGNNIDGVATRIGLRKIEFKGNDGLYLNNEPYPGKLMGANRHQDHAYVGYAIPNNGQYRDAKILKDASCDIVRAAHYPADPAFMDACDALGMFFIVATPGWQFWNNDNPIFGERVFQDIRNMVRRDRNHASVILWEPVLNETFNPDDFTRKTHHIVHEEYPYQGAYTVSDYGVGGHEVFDVVYAHPNNPQLANETRSIFTREFGSIGNADTPNRIHRDWGEKAQLYQANQYAKSDIGIPSWDMICNTPKQHVGGAIWHSFDHYAGKHARPFYGGFVDAFRQSKYAYHMLASQRDVSEENKPMVYIAHEMAAFSDKDVHIYTNCDEVRLTVDEGLEIYQKQASRKYKYRKQLLRKWAERENPPREYEVKRESYLSHPIVVFKDVFTYRGNKNYIKTITGKGTKASFLVEGLIDGKVVASAYKTPANNGYKLELRLKDRNKTLTANGSDFVLVEAHVLDKNGNTVRYNEDTIQFEVTGEGAIIGDASIVANPRRMEWGTAPLLVRATTKAGKIKIKASLLDPGINTIKAGELEIESTPSGDVFVQNEIGIEPTKQ